MGYNLKNRMPLWVKPRTKVSPKQAFDCMRDHYEGTPMDMTKRPGAGGPTALAGARWSSRSTAKPTLNERATATQQTGFWFVGQARADVLPTWGSSVRGRRCRHCRV